MDFLSTLSQWPADWVILGTFAIIVAIDSIRSGSNRAVSLGIAFPLAYATLGTFAQAAFLGPLMAQLTSPYAGAVLFGALLIGYYACTRRIIGFFADTRRHTTQALLAAVACTGIAATVWLQVPALDVVWHFGSMVHMVFGQSFRLWWYLGSFAVFAYVRS